MFEWEKRITNFSLTLLSVANKFDIVVWKSNEYIYFAVYLVKLNVINLTCTESDQTRINLSHRILLGEFFFE